MSRFKVSKFKNTLPVVSKKDYWLHDLNVGNDPRTSCSSPLITASSDHVAFISDFRSIGTISVMPMGSHGRSTSFPHISAHSGMVTDFQFSNFDQSLLASCGEDGLIKLWDVSHDNTLRSSFGPFEGSIEQLQFHSQVDMLLAFADKNGVKVFNLEKETEVFSAATPNVQSISWSGDGSLISAISKADKKKRINIFDPRQKSCVKEFEYHSHIKGSCITWTGLNNQFITTGYAQGSGAEISLWNIDNIAKPVYNCSLGTNGSGSPMVLYDEDTGMAYVGVKGETSISFYEVQDKEPNLSLGPNVYSGREQVKGMCLVPKQALNVMECEVNRLLLLTQNAIIPLSYVVQRKNRSEFQADLYPDTAGSVPASTVDEWLEGKNALRSKVSLDPSKRVMAKKVDKKVDKKVVDKEKSKVTAPKNEKPVEEPDTPSTGTTSTDTNAAGTNSTGTNSSVQETPAAKKQWNIVRSSKVRHIEGTICHKSLSIFSLPKLSTSLSSDSNGFTANTERCAFCLFGSGGLVGIYELKNTGRMDANKLIKLENGTSVMDFMFDPFDNRRIAIALDSGQVKVWSIPSEGSAVYDVVTGHYEKACSLAFHPLARDVLASSSYDQTIIIWDLATLTSQITLGPLPEMVHSIAWSPNGQYLATLTQKHSIQVFEPRVSTNPIKEGSGIPDSRGGRITWLDDGFLLTTGFDKSHNRIACLYSVNDLGQCMGCLSFDSSSPAILIPFYDPDIHVVYLTGKGDSAILTVEFDPNSDPYLFQASTFKCPSSHQSIDFLPKTECDVKAIQVGCGLSLWNSSVERFIFTIPRVKKEYFQDDLFPPTVNTCTPSMTSSEWFSGSNKLQEKLNLCPNGMKPLSEAPQKAAAPKKYESYEKLKSDQEKKDELISAMIGKMNDYGDEETTHNDDADGVDSDEWDD